MICYCTLICSIAGGVVYREKNKVGVGSSLRPKPTHEPNKSKFSSLKRLNSFSKRNSKESVEIKFKRDIEYEDIIGYGTVRIQNNTLDSFKEGRSMMMKYLSKDEKEIDDKFRKYVKCSTLLPEKLHNCFYLDVANVCITACEGDNLSRPEDAENSEPTQKPRRPNSIYGNQNYTTKTDNKKWFTGSLRQKTKDKKPRTANSEPVGSHIFDKLEESAKLYIKFCNVITKIIETEKCNFVLYNIIKSLPSFVDFLHPRTEDDTIIKIDWWFFKLNYESSTENEMSKLYEKVAEDLRRNVMTLDLDHIQELVEKESEALNVKMMSHIVEVKRECMVKEKLNTNTASCNEEDEPNDANNLGSDVHEDNGPNLMTQEENCSIAQIDSDEDYLQKEKAFANMYKMYAANNLDIVSKRKKNGDDFEPDENYDITMILESIAELLKTRGFNKNLFNKYLDMINGNTTMTSNLMLALLEISDSDAKYYAIDIIIENLIHTGSYICKLVTMKCMPANVVDYNRENFNKKFQHQYDESVKSSYRQLDYIDKPIKILCKEYIKSYSDSVVNFFTDPDYSKLVGTHNNITLCTIRNMLILLYNFYTLYSLQRNSF